MSAKSVLSNSSNDVFNEMQSNPNNCVFTHELTIDLMKANNNSNKCQTDINISDQSFKSVKSASKKMRLLPKLKHIFKSSPKDSKTSLKKDKDLKSSDYLRSLCLISDKELKSKSMDELKSSFPLLGIAKSEPLFRDQSGDIVLDLDLLKPKTSDTSVDNKDIENIENCYDFRNKKSIQIIETQKLFKINKQKQKQLNIQINAKKSLLTSVSKMAFSTPLGLRVYKTLPEYQMDWNRIQEITAKNEFFCKTDESLKSWSNSKYNNWKCSTIERKTFTTNFSKRSDNSHYYSFNRRQRLEKMKRIESGLNWKSRLRALNCKPFVLKLFKLQNTETNSHSKVDQKQKKCTNSKVKRRSKLFNQCKSGKSVGHSFDSHLLANRKSPRFANKIRANYSSDDPMRPQSSSNVIKTVDQLKAGAINRMMSVSVVLQPIGLETCQTLGVEWRQSFRSGKIGCYERFVKIDLDLESEEDDQ